MSNDDAEYIMAIDPGRNKCGIAILDKNGSVLLKVTRQINDLESSITEFCHEKRIERVVIGGGTGADEIANRIEKQLNRKAIIVPEGNTTLEARELAWRMEPPGCIWRFVPKLFWPAPKDLDAWAAVVIGIRALQSNELF